jgi:hypothetical protein
MTTNRNVYRRAELTRLFAPASIAIVGASPTPTSLGNWRTSADTGVAWISSTRATKRSAIVSITPRSRLCPEFPISRFFASIVIS